MTLTLKLLKIFLAEIAGAIVFGGILWMIKVSNIGRLASSAFDLILFLWIIYALLVVVFILIKSKNPVVDII